jgi:hypothetical protein
MHRLVCAFLTVTRVIKIALPAGKANPAPPVGPALGSAVRATSTTHFPFHTNYVLSLILLSS